MSGGWGGGSERRGYYLRGRGRLVLGGTINEGVEGGGQFVCICEHVSVSAICIERSWGPYAQRRGRLPPRLSHMSPGLQRDPEQKPVLPSRL